MAYDFIPQIIIGIILVIVGAKLNIDAKAAMIVRLALILIGLVILGYGIFGAWNTLFP